MSRAVDQSLTRNKRDDRLGKAKSAKLGRIGAALLELHYHERDHRPTNSEASAQPTSVCALAQGRLMSLLDDPDHWRAHAEDMRRLASETPDSCTKAMPEHNGSVSKQRVLRSDPHVLTASSPSEPRSPVRLSTPKTSSASTK